jgi:hypothetical protein
VEAAYVEPNKNPVKAGKEKRISGKAGNWEDGKATNRETGKAGNAGPLAAAGPSVSAPGRLTAGADCSSNGRK